MNTDQKIPHLLIEHRVTLNIGCNGRHDWCCGGWGRWRVRSGDESVERHLELVELASAPGAGELTLEPLEAFDLVTPCPGDH